MYKRHRFPPEIIQHVVWLYHRYNLSSRDIEDLMAERGVTVSFEVMASLIESLSRIQFTIPPYMRIIARLSTIYSIWADT
jgi:hypothetical protein